MEAIAGVELGGHSRSTVTTIAASIELGMMAADSLAVANNRKYRTRKLYKVRGAIIGVSGAVDHGMMFVDWYQRGADLNDRPKGNDIAAIVLDDSGLYCYETECYPIVIIDEFAAAGSGPGIALAAMMLGKTPGEAVELACEIDLYTGPRSWSKHSHRKEVIGGRLRQSKELPTCKPTCQTEAKRHPQLGAYENPSPFYRVQGRAYQKRNIPRARRQDLRRYERHSIQPDYLA